MIRKTITTLAAITLVVGALIGLQLATASASSSSTTTLGPYNVIGGADGHVDGTATIALDSTAQTATITFIPAGGLSFTGGYVCIGDNNSAADTGYFTSGTGFTARVNPGGDSKGCPPSGSASSSFMLQQFVGGGPWVINSIPTSWFSDGMYFQIHVTVSNGNTGFPCFVGGTRSSFYGSCTDPGGTPVPVGTLGGIGVAILAGAALGYVQIRRQRRNRLQASSI